MTNFMLLLILLSVATVAVLLLIVIVRLNHVNKKINAINNKVIETSKEGALIDTSNIDQIIKRTTHTLHSELKNKLDVAIKNLDIVISKLDSSTNVEDIKNKKDSIITVFYGTSVSPETALFQSISKQPENVSIFKMIVDNSRDNIAIFEIYEDAIRKIIEEPSFIEGACDFNFPSACRSMVITDIPGEAEKQTDGKWKVIKRAKISFK